MTQEDQDNFIGYKDLVVGIDGKGGIFGQMVKDWVNPNNIKPDGEDLPEANHAEIIEFLNSETFDVFLNCFDVNLTPDEAERNFLATLRATPFIGQIKSSKELGYIDYKSLIYAKCEKCGNPRWVQILHGKPRRTMCRCCAGDLGRQRQHELSLVRKNNG